MDPFTLASQMVREQMPLAVLAFGVIAIYVVIAVRNAFR